MNEAPKWTKHKAQREEESTEKGVILHLLVTGNTYSEEIDDGWTTQIYIKGFNAHVIRIPILFSLFTTSFSYNNCELCGPKTHVTRKPFVELLYNVLHLTRIYRENLYYLSFFVSVIYEQYMYSKDRKHL